MKKTFLAGLATGVMMFGMAGMASATPVTFDIAGGGGGSSVSVTETGWGSLTGTLASDLGNNIFTLNDGETKTVDFFTLDAGGRFAVWTGYDIEATLGFDLPDIDSAGSGGGHFATLGGLISAGTLSWDPATLPDLFTVGGNSISVDFEEGAALALCDGVMVHASITNNGGGTNPVPEPATMLLMGAGLVGLIGARRKMSA